MSQVATNTNDLDIDDGTLPVEDAAQTEANATEETAQIDDDGDVDGSQVSEAETGAEESDDTAEPTEEAPATEDKSATPQDRKDATPADAKPEPAPSDYTKLIATMREEFGEQAAAPFEALAAKTERLEKALAQIENERNEHAKRSDQQIAGQHMTAAGIDAKKHADVYQDAVDYFNLRKQQGKTIDGMAALKWAIRANGGNAEAAPTKTTPKTEKATRLQGLRSVPPKARAASAPLDFDDPAVADGTAPRRSS